MEGKKKKRCSVRLMSKGNKFFSDPNAIKTEDQRRCMEWIQSQNNITKRSRKTFIDRNPTSKYDKMPEASADSLSGLKYHGKGLTIYYICEWKECSQQFKEPMELHDHVRLHILQSNPIRKKYYCFWDLCHFQSECGEEVTRHIFYHAYHTILKTIGEGLSQKINIPRCTNDSRDRNLIPELKTDFTCFWDECNEKYKSIHNFHLHVREHVNFENTLKKAERRRVLPCRWYSCDKSFNIAYRLTEHLKKHINQKVVGCYHCGVIFFNNTNFFDHCKRQEVSQEFQCAQCLKYFSSERLLRIHVLVHVYSHKCTICEMTCTSPYQLAKHIRYRHVLDKPFKCTSCDFRAVSKADLNIHMANKHKKKSFSCRRIGCKFIAKTIHFLRKHEAEVHTKAIYACHCCGKSYKHGRELSNHLKMVHQFQMLPGHRRFIYRMDENGLYRLQTLRIESLEVTEQVSSPLNVATPRYEGISFHITESEETSPNLRGPFKIIATHDSDNLDLPERFDEKYLEDSKQISSKDIIITFKEIDDDGNVIQSKCISGHGITMTPE